MNRQDINQKVRSRLNSIADIRKIQVYAGRDGMAWFHGAGGQK